MRGTRGPFLPNARSGTGLEGISIDVKAKAGPDGDVESSDDLHWRSFTCVEVHSFNRQEKMESIGFIAIALARLPFQFLGWASIFVSIEVGEMCKTPCDIERSEALV